MATTKTHGSRAGPRQRADRTTKSEPDWVAAAEDLILELERFKRGMLDRSRLLKVRRVLQDAAVGGVIQSDAAHAARRLGLVCWAIVSIRFDRPEPAYPKNHEAGALRRHAAALRAWEADFKSVLARRVAQGLELFGVRDLGLVVRSQRRSTGPAPSGLRLAHRAYVAIAKQSLVDVAPAAGSALSPRLETLLVGLAPKSLLRKRLHD